MIIADSFTLSRGLKRNMFVEKCAMETRLDLIIASNHNTLFRWSSNAAYIYTVYIYRTISPAKNVAFRYVFSYTVNRAHH